MQERPRVIAALYFALTLLIVLDIAQPANLTPTADFATVVSGEMHLSGDRERDSFVRLALHGRVLMASAGQGGAPAAIRSTEPPEPARIHAARSEVRIRDAAPSHWPRAALARAPPQRA